MKQVPISQLFDVAKKSLLAGGEIVRKGYQGKLKVSFKSPLSPVTQIDLASEKKIVSIISRRFPEHKFLAEEMSHLEKKDAMPVGPNEYRWIIDPLDGTVNFIHRVPQSAVSIAVERGGKLLAGGVYDPHRDELFMAALGKGATMNGRRIHVSPERKLINSLVVTGFPYDRSEGATKYLEILQPFLTQAADLRRFGAAALDLAWIACGRAEAFFEYKLSPWDVAAGCLLVEEAGGKVTDFFGRSLNVGLPAQTFATNGLVHAEMLQIFKRFFKTHEPAARSLPIGSE